MKNLFKKAAMFLMAAIMIMSMCVPAFAAGNATSADESVGSPLPINIHFIMDENANIPSYPMLFTLVGQSGRAGDSVKVGPTYPDISPFVTPRQWYPQYDFDTWGVTQTTGTKEDVSKYPELAGQVQDGEKFVTCTFNIDFPSIIDSFEEPGTYRYLLMMENSNAGSWMEFRSGYDYKVIDVYVTNNDNNDGLKIAGYVVYDAISPSYHNPGNILEKSTNSYVFYYDDYYPTYDLTLQKLIAGNQANMDDEFEFTITINTPAGGGDGGHPKVSSNAVYTMTTSDDVETHDIVTEWGYGSTTITLGHKDKITLHDLPQNTWIEITEESSDYTTTYQMNSYDITNDTYFSQSMWEDMEVVFTNTKGVVEDISTYDLELENQIIGSYANMNDTFSFNIKIETPNMEAATYEMTTTDNVKTSNITTTDGIGQTSVELGNNDKITICDLPEGTKVTITEDNGDYVATYTVNGDSRDGSTLTKYEITGDTSVVFTNKKDVAVPTGVPYTYGPWIGLTILFAFGVVYMLTKKYKSTLFTE